MAEQCKPTEYEIYMLMDKTLAPYIEAISGDCDMCSRDGLTSRKNPCKTCGEEKRNWLYCIVRFYRNANLDKKDEDNNERETNHVP